jgi:hypothetical protein
MNAAASERAMRSCSIVSGSRIVTDSTVIVCGSMVTQNGVPISTWLR